MDNQWHISLPLTTLLTPPFVGPESNYALPSAVDKTVQDFQAKFPCILSPEWADEPCVIEAGQFRICCSKIHKGLERASHRLAAPFHQVLLYKEMSETTLTCQKLPGLRQDPAIDSVKWSKSHAFEWQCQSWPWPAVWKNCWLSELQALEMPSRPLQSAHLLAVSSAAVDAPWTRSVVKDDER